MRAALVGLLLLATAVPAAANEVEAIRWPASARDAAFTPQISCVFAFDTGGAEICEATGDLWRAGSLTVRTQRGASVYAFVDDMRSGTPRMLALADCGTASCTKTFTLTSTPLARLHVDATGPANSAAVVSVEMTLVAWVEELGLDALLP